MPPQFNILVVDDDQITRRTYQRFLRATRGDVETVADGEQALLALHRKPFDVVLLDAGVSGPGAMSVLRRIKQGWPASEVIVITGHPTVSAAKEAVRLGAYDYVAKPMAPEQLCNLTNGAMTQKQWTLHRVTDPADGAGVGSLTDK